jgi:hypothetical protein
MTQKWPLVSHFPSARRIAANAETAPADSPAPANGIGRPCPERPQVTWRIITDTSQYAEATQPRQASRERRSCDSGPTTTEFLPRLAYL